MNDLHLSANELFKNNQYDNAIIIYNDLINNNYKTDIMNSNIAACYLKQKNFMKSLEYSLISVELNMTNPVFWGRVGYSYKGLKMYKESLKAFKIAYSLENKKIYLNEIDFIINKIDNKINMTNVFNLLLNDKELFNKLKNIKTEVLNTPSTEIFNNNKIIGLIENIVDNL
jgi:tetratricopeptide (TPR) repeat protein